ncbi:MAG: DNA adenine methylase [Legionella sp. 40-6]|nr:Dam family site-specific DNA-(adenine-N6)-methyltransferase [Legionella sp.]OJY15592.1 MAG: DNA adenine methylase [Legionella sp. 40-6]
MRATRPFLKWAGGKYNCLDKIIPSLPAGKRLIEPFTGSGAIYMNTHYNAYILGEKNPDLVNLYSQLKTHGLSFIEYCQEYFTGAYNNKEQYYLLREKFNLTPFNSHRAALFLYLNRHGYNGLCRYNSRGIYNVPFGLYTKPYFPALEMKLFYSKSQYTDFYLQDFRNSFAAAEPGDVIYCDPPYVPINTHTKAFSYTKNQFTLSDQQELADLAAITAARGIPVVISNHDTESTRVFYQRAKIKYFPVARYINCQYQLRKPVQELLAIFN